MEITLRPELKQFVEEKVRNGQFGSVNDVVSGAVEMMKELESLAPSSVDDMRRALQVGLDEIERGEVDDWDVEELKAELRREFKR